MAIGGNFNDPRTWPWAFADGKNGLQDVLGLTAALVVNRNYFNATMGISNAFATVEVTRLGSGSLYGSAFVVPPLTAAVLVGLVVKTWNCEEKIDRKGIRTSCLKIFYSAMKERLGG